MDEKQKYAPDEISEDALFEGKVILYQPKRGYRVSVDAPLLVWFSCTEKHSYNCADLGAGSGAVGLGLLATEQASRVVAVEIQPKLGHLASHNARTNGFQTDYHLIIGDMKQSHGAMENGTFDLVVSNPPFWPADSGRLPMEMERRIACHELQVDLDALLAAAGKLLHPKKGRFCIVYPSRRLDDLLRSLAKVGLNATRAVFVHPHDTDPAQLVLLEARHGRTGQFAIMPPIFLKHTDGSNTTQAQQILSGHFSTALKARKDKRVLAS